MVVGCLVAVLGLPAIGFAAPPQSLDAPLLVQAETNKQAKQSQDRIDKLANQTQDALQDYLTTMQQIDRLKAYNSQISKLIDSQNQEKASIQRQMDQLATERQDVTPLMLKMIDALQQFIELDLPYQKQERLATVQKLRDMMNSADVTIAEKYRQIISAYEDEIDDGRKIESYRGSLTTNGKTRTVNFLRVGRIALVYQTLDGSETGYWDKSTKSWKVENDLKDDVNTALTVAANSSAPQLINIPVPAPQAPATETQQ
jgi:hypothetical protein